MRTERVVKTERQALESLQRLCARAERSSGDALRLMRQWGVDEAARGRVLEALLRDRFIDDSRYAGAFVRDKMRSGGWGIHKLRDALRRKGITPETIEEAVAQAADSAEADLERLLRRKASTVKAASAYDLKGKLVRFAASRGYDMSAAIAVVERIVKDDEE